MTNWAIHIEGAGYHHSGSETDADKQARRIVSDLQESGQFIDNASFFGEGEPKIDLLADQYSDPPPDADDPNAGDPDDGTDPAPAEEPVDDGR